MVDKKYIYTILKEVKFIPTFNKHFLIPNFSIKFILLLQLCYDYVVIYVMIKVKKELVHMKTQPNFDVISTTVLQALLPSLLPSLSIYLHICMYV